jgi:hypothetical protein
LVGISDLADYWQDPVAVSTIVAWVLGILGGIMGTASAWLFRRLHGPKLEVSLEPVLSYPDPEYAIPEQSPREFKSQALRVKAKRRPIHQCKAKMVIDGETDYLLWNPKSGGEAKDLVPEEEVQVPVWQAVRAPEQELFYLNIRNKAEVDIKGLNYSITVEISFLSEDGLLNKKSYRYKICVNSWDTINMVRF